MQKIENLKTLQKKIGYVCGHGGASKSCVKIKKNITEKEIEKYLGSKEEETPKKCIIFRWGTDRNDKYCWRWHNCEYCKEKLGIQFSSSHSLLLCL